MSSSFCIYLEVTLIHSSFCEFPSENVAHLFWVFFMFFWNNVNALIVQNICYDFSLCYKCILFGFCAKDNNNNLIYASFCINLLLFIGNVNILNVNLSLTSSNKN